MSYTTGKRYFRVLQMLNYKLEDGYLLFRRPFVTNLDTLALQLSESQYDNLKKNIDWPIFLYKDVLSIYFYTGDATDTVLQLTIATPYPDIIIQKILDSMQLKKVA